MYHHHQGYKLLLYTKNNDNNLINNSNNNQFCTCRMSNYVYICWVSVPFLPCVLEKFSIIKCTIYTECTCTCTSACYLL